jgi:hypothetical protein
MMAPTDSPETSATNHQPTLRNIQEQGRPQLLGFLKRVYFFWPAEGISASHLQVKEWEEVM